MTSALETIYELFKTVLFVLILAFIMRYFLFQPFLVEGSSMEPNLHNSEYLIVDRLSYRIGQPERGQVIVFSAPDQPGVDYIKRIIGLPNEEIEIGSDIIKVNGQKIDEKYLPQDYQTLISNDPTLTLKKKIGDDEYFVMGDNRQHSLDSRIFGVIKKDKIVGRAWVILYPLDNLGKIFQPSY